MERVMAVLAVSAAQEKVVGNVWARAVFCVRRGGGRRRARRFRVASEGEGLSAVFRVSWRMRRRQSEVEAKPGASGTRRVCACSAGGAHAVYGIHVRRGRVLAWIVQWTKWPRSGTVVFLGVRQGY